MDYIEMMASVAEVSHVTEDGDCESLFKQLLAQLSEVESGLEMAYDERSSTFAAYTTQFYDDQSIYINAAADMLNEIRDWQLGGFAPESKERAVEQVGRMQSVCVTVASHCVTMLDELGDMMVAGEESILFVSRSMLETTLSELHDAASAIADRLKEYLARLD